jgi:hypothetical protein
VINAEGTNIMGATALPNGYLELILSIPNLPASVQSGFGPYTLVLNGASAMMMLGQSINTGVQVKILQPGVYASQPPHVYINPANITPESLLGPNKPGVFPTSYEVGSTLNLLGVGFTGSAKEYVYIKYDCGIANTSLPAHNYTTRDHKRVRRVHSFVQPSKRIKLREHGYYE